MAIKVKYSPLMLRKARKLLDTAKEIATGRGRNKAREEYCQLTYGLSYDYLSKVGRVHQRPSARVIDNLGLELWVRDPETGEEERLEFDYACNWTPMAPGQPRKFKANPTSTSESKSAPTEA